MPAAGMRRTSRVFGVVQGGDGARVLRSGRRPWPDDNQFKFSIKSDEDDCFTSVEEAPQALPIPQDEPTVSNGLNYGTFEDSISRELDADCGRMFGIVYIRKRKRLRFLGGDNNVDVSDDRMYGTYYVRRRKIGRVASYLSCLEIDDIEHRVIFVTFKGLPRNLHLYATCFASVLYYMWNTSVELRELVDFLASQPIAMVFSKAGVSFSLEPSTDETKCCKIYYVPGLKPLFDVNFASLPKCFMYIHLTMLLEAERSSLSFLKHQRCMYGTCELIIDIQNNHLVDSFVFEKPVTELMSTFEAPLTLLDRTSGLQEAIHSRTVTRSTFRILKKKRTSQRSKKAQKFSLFFSLRSSRRRSTSDLFTLNNRSPLPLKFGNKFCRKPACSNLGVRNKRFKSLKSGSREQAALISCSANLLVIEADKCYREEGAHILLEQYPSMEWFLVVKRNGLIKCCFRAEKIMRPCSSNHVTHDIIWIVTYSLKLEFPDKSDWEAFMELYTECAERNRVASTAKFIPIPSVIEVSNYRDEHSVPFSLPEAYIRQIGDEVTQALTRRNSNYDMDSEDEEWLNNFNSVSCRENLPVAPVTDETFELIIDSLEKASYFMAVDFESGEVPANLCSDLCTREVLEAVHRYWISKRKKKQAVLVRVFQPPKYPDDQDNFQHKRKQTKRSAGQSIKAKQQRTAASMKDNAFNNPANELNVMVEVETADALAMQYTDMAVKKRAIAQKLMVNADLLMFKAKMSMKIAEEAKNRASELADSTDFLNQDPSPPQPLG